VALIQYNLPDALALDATERELSRSLEVEGPGPSAIHSSKAALWYSYWLIRSNLLWR